MNWGGMVVMMIVLMGGIVIWIVGQARAQKTERGNERPITCTNCGASTLNQYNCQSCGTSRAFASKLNQPAPYVPPYIAPAPNVAPTVAAPSPYAPPAPPKVNVPMGAAVKITNGLQMPGAPPCPNCQGITVYVPDQNGFGCARCERMLA